MTRATSLYRLVVLLLGLVLAAAPSCKSKAQEPADESDVTADASDVDAEGTEGLLDSAQREASLKKDYEGVMFRRHLATAKRYRDGLEFESALHEVEKALNYRPTSDAAIELRAEVLRLMGDRAGETRTVMADQYEGFKVKRQEQRVTVLRKLSEGKRATDVQDYREARNAYEQAAFIVSSAKLSPLGADDELSKLGATAEDGLREVERLEAQARVAQDRRDTEDALRLMARAEERDVMEARERHEKLLNAAIDNFNLEHFDKAEAYAQDVLDEEPDNRVARDVAENARRARHTAVGERYLRDLKDSFRRWQVDIANTKVPSSKILKWPSQQFWDKITELRARREAAAGGRQLTAEEQAVFNRIHGRKIDLPFDDTAFPQVVEYFAASSGVNFVVDARAKEDLDAVTVTVTADDVSVSDGLDLVMLQVSADGEVVYEIVGNVVRFIKKEHQKKNMVLRIHPAADLTLGLTDFIPPDITLVGVDEDSEQPLFGGQTEEAPQPFGTIEELMELVRGAVSPQTWEEGGTLSNQGKNLIIYAPPNVQNQVSKFLDDLREFTGIVITIESRFLTVSDLFLRDFGVDMRGLGGTNGGPLAVLDDITSGLDDGASAGFDNTGPGVGGGGAALSPSSGLFFNDGSDGDLRARTENIFASPLGNMLTALGGGTFAITFLDDLALSFVIRATEKSQQIRELTAPSLTVYNTQRANISVVKQISYIQDFDVEVAQTSFIADPVVGVIQEGIVLDVRPTVSNDRQFITLEVRPTITDLTTPIETFTTLLGAGATTPAVIQLLIPSQSPVTIQLPEIDIRQAETTVRMPDGGSILLGGLKTINVADKETSTPVLGDLPLLRFLFRRQGKSEELSHLMIIVTATITDLGEQADLRIR